MSFATIAVVDYGMGNRRSAQKALERVGARVVVTGDAAELNAADGLVLPGVGAFPRAMAEISGRGLDVVLHERAGTGTPVLGLCLGLQLLFDGSDELGGAEGLGLLPGPVRRLEPRGERLPHIGWSAVTWSQAGTGRVGLRDGLDDGEAFYHVHSYAPVPAEESDVIAVATHGEDFVTAAARDNVMGVQFHPEKSSRAGLTLLENFVSLCVPVAA